MSDSFVARDEQDKQEVAESVIAHAVRAGLGDTVQWRKAEHSWQKDRARALHHQVSKQSFVMPVGAYQRIFKEK